MADDESKIQKSSADEEFSKSVDDIADILLKEEEVNYKQGLEPFDVYAQKVRKEIHASMEEFRNRFLKGYELLLNELSQQYTGSFAQKSDIPPGAIKL